VVFAINFNSACRLAKYGNSAQTDKKIRLCLPAYKRAGSDSMRGVENGETLVLHPGRVAAALWLAILGEMRWLVVGYSIGLFEFEICD
jgi:hypothetical protein